MNLDKNMILYIEEILKTTVSLTNDLLKMNNIVPILVIINDKSTNPFGSYVEEILKTEGFNEFETKQLLEIDINILNTFSVVILTETILSPEQSNMLNSFVAGGGNLIAFRPDKQLSSLFGIEPINRIISEGYILIDTKTDTGIGLIEETIQFHGEADLYNITGIGSKALAILYTDESTATVNPAIIYNQYFKGIAIAFAYDLSKSIIYTRQGNPSWAGQERDGIRGIRPVDMFVGYPQAPNWINNSKISITQADEQMRILSHIIEKLCANKLPLPRLWYFPYCKNCLLIFTGDGENSPVEEIDNEIKDVQNSGGNITVYLIGTYISPQTVHEWLNEGNEISIHYDDALEAEKPSLATMTNVYDTMTENFKSAYGFAPHTVRNHWGTWYGWSEQAQIESNHGHYLDCNYYYFDALSSLGNFLGGPGTFTGSGLPMKFCDNNGHIINIYQSETQLPDEQWKNDIYVAFKKIFDKSMYSENYTLINANFHPNRWMLYSNYAIRIIKHCLFHDIPVWPAQRIVDFLLMKDAANFKNIVWLDNTLNFQLESPVIDKGLTFMLPFMFNNLYLSAVLIDGIDQSYIIKNIAGKEYALINTNSGTTYNIKAVYQTSKPPLNPESMFTNWSGNISDDINVAQYELGTVFQSSVPGKIVGIKVYGVNGEYGEHIIRIWDNITNEIIGGPYIFNFTGKNNWNTFILPAPISINEDIYYTVSVTTGSDNKKNYAYIYDDFQQEGNNSSHLKWPKNAGVFTSQIGKRPTESYRSINYLRDIIFIPD